MSETTNNTAEAELAPDWCRQFSKGLAVFNKAFIHRAGKGLFPYVLLKGDKPSTDYCIKKEAQLFFENGIYDSDNVNTALSSTRRGVYQAGTWSNEQDSLYEALAKNGSLLFFTDGAPDHANTYDVSQCSTVSFRESLIPMLGMDLSEEVAEKVLSKYPKLLAMDILSVANYTMLNHYSNSEDDEVLSESDFDWVVNGIEDYEPDKDNQETDEKSYEQPQKDTALDDKPAAREETRKKPQETFEEESKAKPEPVVVPVPVPVEKAGDKSEKKDEAADTQPTAEAIPAQKKSGVDEYGLTAEDEKHNEELLNDIRKEYDAVIQLITNESVPALFSPLKKVLEQSKESNDYSESPIKKYIEISKDFSTDVYNRLYKNTEPLRISFNKNVKRKMKHITCFNCSKEWDVDVTFMEGSIGESECPKCKTLIRFEP